MSVKINWQLAETGSEINPLAKASKEQTMNRTSTISKSRMETPWGPAQTIKVIALGITSVSTAGHGGYFLDDDRHAQLGRMFPGFTTYAGGPWYEEDEDVVAVILAFSDEFDGEKVFRAVRHVQARGSKVWTAGGTPSRV